MSTSTVSSFFSTIHHRVGTDESRKSLINARETFAEFGFPATECLRRAMSDFVPE